MKHKAFEKLVPVVVILIAAGIAAVQVSAQRLNIKNYGPEEGLPQPQVDTIFQDSRGYMWFGTHAGACRFNGVTFEVFDTGNGMISNTIEDIDEDARGRILLATLHGLSIYDSKKFQHYNSENGLLGDHVYDVYVEGDETIWIATNGGVSSLKGQKIKHYIPDEGMGGGHCQVVYRSSEGRLLVGTDKGYYELKGDELIRQVLSENFDAPTIYFFIEDFEGSLWIGTSRGLFRKRGSSTEYINPEIADSTIRATRVRSAAIEKDGTLWFGTAEGVLCYSDKELKHYTTANGFFHNTIYDTLIDNEQNIWFGTALGISKLRHGPFVYYNEATGLVADGAGRIYEDSRGRLWISSWSSGLTVFEEDKTWSLAPDRGLTDPFVISLTETPDGKMLIGTVRGIHSWDGNRVSVLANYGASYLFTDSRGRVWLGLSKGVATLESGQIRKLVEDSRFPKSYVHCITEDNNGNIWFGTREEGCYVFDGIDSTVLDKDDGLTNLQIHAIDTDSSGKVWIGTLGDGVFCFDGEEFINIRKEDGLSDNYVWQVLADSAGSVWFGTSSGIDRYDGDAFEHFDINDGLAYNEGIESACLEDSQGRLWFGSIKGLSQFIGSKTDNLNFSPPVYIERFLINKQERDPSQQFELKADENNFDFSFIGLSYLDEDKVRYRYWLEGLDNTWSESTTERTIRYTNVPPGNYTFRVKASNSAGNWSVAAATVGFTILPHFYQTPWFVALAVFVTALLVVTGHRLFVRKIKKDKDNLEMQVRDRTKAISAANEELKSFSYSISHDLRAPTRHIDGYCKVLVDDYAEQLDADGAEIVNKIRNSAQRIRRLIEDLMKLSKVSQGGIRLKKLNLSKIVRSIAADLQRSDPERTVEFAIEEDINAEGDEVLIMVAIENLLNNAWKFTGREPEATIEFGKKTENGKQVFYVGDNGVGFDPAKTDKLFIPFKRLHQNEHFAGTGIGLATVRRIIHRHGGRIWAEAEEGKGATFYFTLN